MNFGTTFFARFRPREFSDIRHQSSNGERDPFRPHRRAGSTGRYIIAVRTALRTLPVDRPRRPDGWQPATNYSKLAILSVNRV